MTEGPGRLDDLNELPGLVRTGLWVAQNIGDLAPRFSKAAEEAIDLGAFVDHMPHGAATDRRRQALVELNNNACNDWLDLLTEAMSGSGRQALRAARSLFEISLVAPALLEEPGLADRFIDHKTIVASKFAALNADMEFRTGVDRRRAEHERKKWRRDWGPAAQSAIEMYGDRFARQWDTKTVRDRAVGAGRMAEYEAYSVASATVHGGAGALFGTLVTYPDQSPVHRLGPNLMVCPLAVLYGSLSWRVYLQALRDNGVQAAEGPIAAVNHLLSTWVDYEKAVAQIDAAIWPKDAPEAYRLVAVISSTDIAELYLHDPANNRVIKAKVVDDTVSVRERLNKVIESLRRNHPTRNVSQSVLIPGGRAVPVIGESWIPAEDVLPNVDATRLAAMPGTKVVLEDVVAILGDGGLPVDVERSP